MSATFIESAWPFAVNLALAVATASGLFAVALLASRKAAPPIREALAKAAITVIAICPLVVLVSSQLHLGSLNAPTEAAFAKPARSTASEGAAQTESRPPSEELIVPETAHGAAVASQTALQTPVASGFDYKAGILAAGLAGSLFLVALVGIGRLRLAKLAKGWEKVEDTSLLSMLEQASQATGLRAVPILIHAEDLRAPVCFSAGKDYVAVPTDISDFLPPEQIKSAFIHECVHLKAKHQTWRLLCVLMEAAYWWAVPVWLVRRHLEDAQEKICDSYVVQTTDTGRHLAECLVTLATRNGQTWTPRGTIAVFRRGELEARIRRLLDKGANTMTKTTKRSVAVIAAIAAGAFVLAAKMQVGEVSAKGSEYFPSTEGTTWTYKVSRPGSEDMIWTTVAWSVKSYKGMPVVEYRSDYGHYNGYGYVLLAKDGAYEMDRQYKDLPGFRRADTNTVVMKFPATAGTKWSHRTQPAYQTAQSFGNDTPPPKPPTYEYTRNVVSDNVMVDTPIGRKKAVIIEMSVSEDGGKPYVRSRTWMSPGLGTVREEVFEPGGKTSQVKTLVDFKPGSPQNQTPSNPAELVRQKTPQLSLPANAYRNIANSHLDDTYRSRFVAVGSDSSMAIYRVTGQTVRPFDPTNVDEWNALIEEEMPKSKRAIPGPNGYDLFVHFESIAILLATKQGYFVDDNAKGGNAEYTSKAGSSGTIGRTKVSGRNPDGSAWTLAVVVTMEGSKITSIETQ
ncbi:MAG: M56 family metallopeptidase [Fimbriimonadaceae bacterium]|nr:M56 family metallopeptidase [Fimbriimonadaceae bacterium]